jgi:inorganic pyrophosphatase
MSLPLTEFEGQRIAVIQHLGDQDDKQDFAPYGIEYTDEQIMVLTGFQERFFEPVVRRDAHFERRYY